MKKYLIILISLLFAQNSVAQIKSHYGITGGLNVSTGILPELKINSLSNIIHGDDVVQGDPQLADFVNLYKVGLFYRLDGGIGSAKLTLSYTSTNIHKDIETLLGDINALDINLSYLDLGFSYNLNIFHHFYFSAGYVPSILINHDGNLDINLFDQRVSGGFGYRFSNGMSIDLDTLVGIEEIIDGSYIHNVMIPITVSIPLK